jgi:hypothetical protein
MLLRDHLVRELNALNEAAHQQCREHERRGAPTAVSATPSTRRRARS